jgi:uncharacterized protein
MTSPDDLFNPLYEAEYEELDEFLLSLEYDEGIYCVSELDGFFTAVVSGPVMVPPSQWLPIVWGDHEHSPEWESEEAFQHIFSLLMRLMNTTAAILMEAPWEFEACFMEHIHEEKRYTVVDEWCEGYMKGVALCPERWDEMPCAREDYLAPMLMFTTEDGWRQLEDMTEEELEFWQGQIEPAARRIHTYWLEQRSGAPEAPFHMPMLPGIAANDEPFVREEPKVGRNDPCPCGSGKKYKKCCGL